MCTMQNSCYFLEEKKSLKKKKVSKKKYHSDELKHLNGALVLLWNSTDSSKDLCKSCMDEGIIERILEALSDKRLAVGELKHEVIDLRNKN